MDGIVHSNVKFCNADLSYQKFHRIEKREELGEKDNKMKCKTDTNLTFKVKKINTQMGSCYCGMAHSEVATGGDSLHI
jgi:hypothetical protein